MINRNLLFATALLVPVAFSCSSGDDNTATTEQGGNVMVAMGEDFLSISNYTDPSSYAGFDTTRLNASTAIAWAIKRAPQDGNLKTALSKLQSSKKLAPFATTESEADCEDNMAETIAAAKEGDTSFSFWVKCPCSATGIEKVSFTFSISDSAFTSSMKGETETGICEVTVPAGTSCSWAGQTVKYTDTFNASTTFSSSATSIPIDMDGKITVTAPEETVCSFDLSGSVSLTTGETTWNDGSKICGLDVNTIDATEACKAAAGDE